MSETPTAVTKVEKDLTEFQPFGAEDKVKLSIAIVRDMIEVKTKSGASCSNADALKFIAMCKAKRLNPFEGDAFLIGYDTKDGPRFSLITAHQTYLKRAELHPEFDGMESGVIIKFGDGTMLERQGDYYEGGETVVGGWAKVHFKTRKFPMYKRVRMERFKKPFGIWLDDAAGMIVKCAEADALRSAFPTMLGGLYMREELDAPDVDDKPKVSSPIFDTPSIAPSKEPVPEASLKELRELCVKAKVKERDLLQQLVSMRIIDEAQDSLEAIALTAPSVIFHVVDHWPDIVANMP